MKPKTIRVYLRPEDFRNSRFTSWEDCPAARALKRHFKTHNVKMVVHHCEINYYKYEVLKSFESADHDYVRSQYRLDPKMKKAQFYITLIKV